MDPTNAAVDSRLPAPPIIIGGCGRSGTTLMLSVLSAHPAVLAIPEETEVFCPTAWSKKHVDLDAPFEVDKLRRRLAQEAVSPPKQRWCEKSPKNILYFERILAFFSRHVALIHMVRDGRDVVTSRHPRRSNEPWVTPDRWVSDVHAGAQHDSDDRVTVVRYEDLVRDFEQTMARVCERVGLELTAEILNWHNHATVRRHSAWDLEVQPLHSRSLGVWRDPQHRDPVRALLAMPRARELLGNYGYGNRLESGDLG